jgi:hypothetical protein
MSVVVVVSGGTEDHFEFEGKENVYVGDVLDKLAYSDALAGMPKLAIFEKFR